jgi:hypothetical protein
MSFNRRNFLRLGSLIACGTAIGGPSLIAAAPRVLSAGLPLVPGDETVLAFVRSYSGNFRIVGVSVLGRIRTSGLRALHIIAEVNDADRMAAVLPGAPFRGIYTENNTVTFALADVDVTIENLLPDVFAARLASMAKRSGNAFAHDALSYNPETQELSDPFNAHSSALKIVNKTFGGPAALESGCASRDCTRNRCAEAFGKFFPTARCACGQVAAGRCGSTAPIALDRNGAQASFQHQRCRCDCRVQGFARCLRRGCDGCCDLARGFDSSGNLKQCRRRSCDGVAPERNAFSGAPLATRSGTGRGNHPRLIATDI